KLGDAPGKARDPLVQFGCDGKGAEVLEGIDQCGAKAGESIAVLDYAAALDLDQLRVNLLGRVVLVVEKRDELGDRLVEVDVVFPERIVGVDEQRLGLGDDGQPGWRGKGVYPTNSTLTLLGITPAACPMSRKRRMAS